MQNSSQLLALYEAYLEKNPFPKNPKELYQPADYILKIGGKRIRPLLTLIGCGLFDSKIEKALPAAHALEIFHNFSLVHDDIMDAAPLRRGQLTVHEKFGINNAILTGDVMLIYAYRFLMQLENTEVLRAVLEEFNKVAVEVCEGQQWDVNFENDTEVTMEQYLKMIEYKTAALLGGALKIGALTGGAPPDDAAHLAEFGRKMGIAFQIQDDLLDTFGDPEKFGKKPGGDIVQNKKTLLFLKALESGNSEQVMTLKKLYSEKTMPENEKTERVIEIFNQLKIKDFATQLQAKYIAEANAHLSLVKAPEQKKEMLEIWAAGLVNREI